jgi:electron transfer flavoprotein beta subunit
MAIEVVDGGKALKVGREIDTGVLTVKVQLPAVVTVDLRIDADSVKNGVTPADYKYNEGALRVAQGIMAAKKKPIDAKSLADLGATGAPVVSYTKFELPPARSGKVTYVENVQQLVEKLRTVAKVL